MLKKHDLGITPYIENISSRDRSLVRMGTSRVYVQSRLVLFGFPIGRYEVDRVSLVLVIFFAPRSITKTQVSFGECRAVG